MERCRWIIICSHIARRYSSFPRRTFRRCSSTVSSRSTLLPHSVRLPAVEYYRRTMSSHANGPAEIVVPSEEIRRYMIDCLRTADVSQSHAEQMADVLVAADLRGHYSHGLNRLAMYVQDIKKGVCAKAGEPKILKEKASTAWVDGNNLLGAIVGNFCMQLAMKKAKESGIGWISAKGSNHYGIAGFYSMQALNEGLIGMSFTNTSPIMVPTRAKKASIGTNPLTLAAPGTGGDSFVLDMATTGVAVGKVEMQQRKGELLPKGWAVDVDGHEVTDPREYAALYPLGGTEITSGYKGYGLGMMVELFCGILSGGAWGPNVRRWMATDRDADLGQCFVAIDPDAFAPGFPERMQEFMDKMRGLDTVDGETRNVLVAGDPERAHIKLVNDLGGIPYHPNQIKFADELATELGVNPPVTKK